METEVRRSDRIKKDNAGFKRGSCSNNKCLPCNVLTTIAQKSVVKNLTTSLCKVADQEIGEKISKKPKRKVGEELAGVLPTNENMKDSSSV